MKKFFMRASGKQIYDLEGKQLKKPFEYKYSLFFKSRKKRMEESKGLALFVSDTLVDVGMVGNCKGLKYTELSEKDFNTQILKTP